MTDKCEEEDDVNGHSIFVKLETCGLKPTYVSIKGVKLCPIHKARINSDYHLFKVLEAPKPLSVGTRIKFLKSLTSGPDEFSPGNLYATKGELGTVVGHNCFEGHMVLWDGWDASFGAELGTEFEEYKENL